MTAEERIEGSNTPDSTSENEAHTSAEESSDDESGSETPTYSTEELVTIITDFYKFLTTIHYDPATLKFPPPEGWAIEQLSIAEDQKSPLMIDLMRQLPYFDDTSDPSYHVHYKSKLVDYTSGVPHEGYLEWVDDDFECHKGDIVDRTNLLALSEGYESGGRTLILDVLHGEITEVILRCDQMSPVDIVEYFNQLKDDYRSLKLIPCPGRETKEAVDIPECAEHISEEQIRAQAESWHGGTHLNWQFIRQVYREYGWPEAFRREECVKYINDFMTAQDKQIGDQWETAAN